MQTKNADKNIKLLSNYKQKITSIPNHIAFILDGNRRWAKKHNKSSNIGHKYGIRNIETICNLCIKYNIKYLTLYCLSVENLNRSKQELNFLFAYIKQYLSNKNINQIHQKNINFRIIGDFTLLPKNLQNCIEVANENQIQNSKLNLQICICYSGRNEIINSVKRIINDIETKVITSKQAKNITEKEFEKYLFSGSYPDVDLMIRTGGEIRISNFLLWKISYAELYFCKTLFPDFNENDFLLALYNFQSKNRRYGK